MLTFEVDNYQEFVCQAITDPVELARLAIRPEELDIKPNIIVDENATDEPPAGS